MNRSNLVTWEVIENIGIMSIENGSQNKISDPEFVEIGKLTEWINDSEVVGLIITSMKRNFSLGADIETIKTAAQNESFIREKLAKGKAVLDFLSNLSIPCIAAVKGVCFGAGLEIALACHFRICSENSVFGFPESNLNLLPGLSGTVRLPGLVSISNTIEIILSGDTVNAEKALQIGLVDYIVPKKEIIEFSIALLKKMTSGKPLYVIRSIMQAINNYRNMPHEKALTEESRLFSELAKREFC